MISPFAAQLALWLVDDETVDMISDVAAQLLLDAGVVELGPGHRYILTETGAQETAEFLRRQVPDASRGQMSSTHPLVGRIVAGVDDNSHDRLRIMFDDGSQLDQVTEGEPLECVLTELRGVDDLREVWQR